MTTRLAEYIDARELWVNLTLRELRGKYKRSVLGWTWSLLNPLATVLIFTLVFRFFLRIIPPPGDPSGLQNFSLFLLCGLLPWNFLANTLNGGMGALVGNANLIKKVWFPREVLVAATVASWVVSLLIELGVLAAILLLFGNMVLPWLPVVLALVTLQTVFVFGFGLMLGAANVYFRDVQHLIGIALQVWFYATPIVYPMSFVPDEARLFGTTVPVGALYRLNPMVTFVEAYRDAFYDLRFPPVSSWLYLLAWSVAAVAIGLAVFHRLEPRFAEEL